MINATFGKVALIKKSEVLESTINFDLPTVEVRNIKKMMGEVLPASIKATTMGVTPFNRQVEAMSDEVIYDLAIKAMGDSRKYIDSGKFMPGKLRGRYRASKKANGRDITGEAFIEMITPALRVTLVKETLDLNLINEMRIKAGLHIWQDETRK